jgi:hypothetical protein
MGGAAHIRGQGIGIDGVGRIAGIADADLGGAGRYLCLVGPGRLVMHGFDLQHILCHARDGIDDGIMAGKGVSAASEGAGMAKRRQAAIAAGCLLMLASIV